MQSYEDKTGGRVLAIAHNGNLSQRHHVPDRSSRSPGKPIDVEYAETRARWEPLYEATQIKGDGEAHPFLSPERRVRRLRDLGPGQPRPQRGQRGRHAAVRVRALRAADRPAARAEARRQPVQVRHDRLHRQPHRARHRRGGQLLRQALRRRARAPERYEHPMAKLGRHRSTTGWSMVVVGLRRRLGHARTRARRSSTR